MKILLLIVLMLNFWLLSLAQQVDSLSNQRKMPWFVEKFKLTAGFFVPVNNTNIQVGINGSAHGTDVDFETDLGFAKNIGTFLGNFQWRISRRSRISASFFNIDRESSHTLNKDIIFKEDTFHANTSINSFFRTPIYQVSYGYALVSKPKYEVGLMIGAHVVGASAGMSSTNNNGGVSKNTDFGFTAPLPDLGLWGGYAFSDRFAINFEGDYLSLTVGDFTGSILAYNVAFVYKVLDKLQLSLGYTGLNCKLDIVKEHADGHFKWGYNGPALAVTFPFGKFH